MMGSEKEHLTPDGICRIIETAGKNGVLELHVGSLSVFFTVDRQMKTYESRKPDIGSRVAPVKPRQSQSSSSFPKTEVEEEALKIEAIKAQDERISELMLTDPVLAERLLMDEAGELHGEDEEDEDPGP